MKDKSRLEVYVRDKLLSIEALKPYLVESAIVETGSDFGLVWDFMVLMPENIFQVDFTHRFGNTFVVDDHDQDPPVFTRFKDYEWLKRDFARRLPVALWIFRKACVLRDPEGFFGQTISIQERLFKEKLVGIIRSKYLEFRGERHNLRQSISQNRLEPVEVDLIRATVVKLAFELILLSFGLPYPYKRCLPDEVKKVGPEGSALLTISSRFLRETDGSAIISISDSLVAMVIKIIADKKMLDESFLQQWWNHLD